MKSSARRLERDPIGYNEHDSTHRADHRHASPQADALTDTPVSLDELEPLWTGSADSSRLYGFVVGDLPMTITLSSGLVVSAAAVPSVRLTRSAVHGPRSLSARLTAMSGPTEHEDYMRLALDAARRAGEHGEVPVGAMLVQRGRIVATRGNERELRHDPTAHAEMLVLRDAAALLGGWRVLDATLYVTLEPCPMCAGALVQARVTRLVYGAADPNGGAAGTVLDITSHPMLNHTVDVTGGVLAKDAALLLREFFEIRR